MTIQTSKTHPLRVDWLPEGLAGMPGRLGMTFGPGKYDPNALGGSWERDLAADLDRLKEHYKVDCLVTLLEESELTALRMDDLIEEGRARYLDLYWWKWPQGTVPDDPEVMEALVDHVLCRVYNGERVVVHCRGGLGRTGTAVACCLRAMEYTPEEVFKIVRGARQGAIETTSQERFISEYDRRWAPGSPSRRDLPWGRYYWQHIEHHIKQLERMDQIPESTPRRVSPDILSTKRADDPRILHVIAGPLSLAQKEQELIEVFASKVEFDWRDVPHTVLDAIIDRAVRSQELDIKPELAALALKRLLSLLAPWPADVDRPDKPQEFPHLLNGARRLFLIAESSLKGGIECSDELRQSIKDAIWLDDPLERFEIRKTGSKSWALYDAMQMCALRFDGYRYRELRAQPEESSWHSLDITTRLERYADYEFHCPFDLLTSFFLVQRALGGWGAERSGAEAAIRRVYLELFILTHDLYVPPRLAMIDAGSAYYLWRWAYQPVAEPFVEMAREELRTGNFEGPKLDI